MDINLASTGPLAVAWVLDCAAHSLMATLTVPGAVKKDVGAIGRRYRLFYDIFAVLTLGPIVHMEKVLAEGLYVTCSGNNYRRAKTGYGL